MFHSRTYCGYVTLGKCYKHPHVFHSRTNCGYVTLGKCYEHPIMFHSRTNCGYATWVSVMSILICFTEGQTVAM